MQPIATPPAFRVITFASPARRWLLLLPVVAAITGCFFTLRWTAGDTLARTAINRELAEFSVRLAPADPQTHFALGKAVESSLLPGDQEFAIREYEAAVHLAPHDYRLWMILAVGRERNGDIPRAETAYLEAQRLAPAYSMPQWAAGNFFLRQGRANDAMSRLMNAGESMERLRRPVLDLAFGFYDHDVDAMMDQIGPRTQMRRALLQMMLDRSPPFYALRVWARLDPSERMAAAPLGNSLISLLVSTGSYGMAREVRNQISPGRATPTNEIENRSFEEDVATDGANLFGWRLSGGSQPQIALDSGQSRGRSLLLSFNVSDRAPLRAVTQMIVADSSRRFRLSYFVRASEITGAATIRVQVLDPIDQTVLAQSEPVPVGTSEWRSETLDFSAPASSDAIILRLGAVTCPAEFCPAFGRVWYDDFELKQIDGPGTR